MSEEANNRAEDAGSAQLDVGHIGNMSIAEHRAQAEAERQAYLDEQAIVREQQIRAAALEASLRLYSGSGHPLTEILAHAKTIEAYLQGPAK